ncbi:MAG: NifB/NifX family molybdenum-iron cluster-binding protein [Rikenellaceae bacterium]|nr:NifB/NifX family molybdenum-iron cluster-binding protein [Rikenellaceae bacterium]
MKIALPTRDGRIDDHFGHCESYTIFTVDGDRKITTAESMASPEGCGCKSGVAPVLAARGVTVMLAGNMGQGAVNVLSGNGITVVRGCSGDVRAVAEAYLAGSLADSGDVCRQHGEGDHRCGNH